MRNAILALALVALLGCATTYRPMDRSGGYDETKLAEGRYVVRFSANGDTDPAVVRQYLLRRCAELSLENGSRWFEVVSSDRQVETKRVGKINETRQNSQAMIRVLPANTADARDAVRIVKETDRVAKGELSRPAQETLRRLGVVPPT